MIGTVHSKTNPVSEDDGMSPGENILIASTRWRKQILMDLSETACSSPRHTYIKQLPETSGPVSLVLLLAGEVHLTYMCKIRGA